MGNDQKHWKTGWAGQVTWETRIGDLRLTVVAQPFLKRKFATVRWAGIALEAPSEAETLSEILSRHSHADIGDYETLGECVVACEEYIERWTSEKMRTALCECVEIALHGEAGEAVESDVATRGKQVFGGEF